MVRDEEETVIGRMPLLEYRFFLCVGVLVTARISDSNDSTNKVYILLKIPNSNSMAKRTSMTMSGCCSGPYCLVLLCSN